MLRDFRIALRSLRSWRLGAVIATATLAVAIGATTSLYAILRAALSSSATQIEDVAQLGRIYASNPAAGLERAPISLADFTTSLAHAHSFEAIAALTSADMTTTSDSVDVLSVTVVSPAYFSVLHARPVAGRLFTSADFESGAPVALISDRVWRRQFGEQQITDRLVISLNGIDRQVIGIVPEAYEFPLIGIGGDAWVPMTGRETVEGAPVSVLARLKPEISWATAAGELSSLAAVERQSSWRWHVIPVGQDARYRTLAGTTATLLPAFVVLIVGCVNVACLLLARGLERAPELNVRAALGASRVALIRQLAIENLTLASVAGLAGFGVAVGVLRLVASSPFVATKPALAAHLSGDLALLPIAITSTVLATVLFGTIPALRLSRPDTSWLKGIPSSPRARVAGYGARDLIVFLELGLAVVLVVVTAMWLSFFSAWQHMTIAFRAGEVIAVQVASGNLADVSDRVSALPSIESVAVASRPPGAQSSPAQVRSGNGRIAAVDVIDASDSFFVTTGLPIVRGRVFTRAEFVATAPVAVVSERTVQALWPDAEPIGQILDISDRGPSARVTVIGVASDAVEHSTSTPQRGNVYRPLKPAESHDYFLLVRTRSAHESLRAVATAARASTTAPQPRAIVIGDEIGRAPEGVSLIRFFGGFALVALLLAGSGIFGVISQSVTQRTKEFGVRLALGATPGQVLRMVLTREGKLIGAALAAGSIGTVAVTRTLFADLVSTSVMNPEWPIALMALCGVVAALSCGVATYRIVRLDPWSVLRST